MSALHLAPKSVLTFSQKKFFARVVLGTKRSSQRWCFEIVADEHRMSELETQIRLAMTCLNSIFGGGKIFKKFSKIFSQRVNLLSESSRLGNFLTE